LSAAIALAFVCGAAIPEKPSDRTHDAIPSAVDGPRAMTVAGPPVLAGAKVRREVAGARFEIEIDPIVARVTTSLQFGSATSGALVMTPQSPVSRIDLQVDSARVTGSLMTRFCAPPSASSLQADLVVSNGRASAVADAGVGPEPPSELAYRGDLLTWDSPVAEVVQRFTTYVTPTLHLDVDLTDSTATEIDSGALSATVRFVYVTQVIGAETLSATSPTVGLPKFSAGRMTVAPDGLLTYRPATPLEAGEIKANLSVVDGGLAPFTFDAAIADWTWPLVRPRNCSTLPTAEPRVMQLGVPSSSGPDTATTADELRERLGLAAHPVPDANSR
jgi:hypothetical protein